MELDCENTCDNNISIRILSLQQSFYVEKNRILYMNGERMRDFNRNKLQFYKYSYTLVPVNWHC